jgi:predicted RND superfamily exporter protein
MATRRDLVSFLSRWHAPVTVGFLAIMVVLGLQMSRLQTSVRIETLFPAKSRILADYRWLEEHVAPLVPIEVVVTFDSSSPLPFQQRLAELQRIEAELRACPHVHGSLSALTFLPPLPFLQSPAKEPGVSPQLAEQMLARIQPAWTRMHFLSQTDGRQQWRIRALVSAVEPSDYGLLLADIQRRLAHHRKASTDTPIVGCAARATGVMPRVHDVQRQLMIDLRSSFLLAFLIITIVMTVMQGSVGAGLVAMVPNLFPTLLMFGLLGWLEMPADIGSVMTASVALGVAVDDTLHFLTYFQRSLAAGISRRDAVAESYRHCGRAMVQSSVICGAGMSVFALSDFVPTARFAWMIVALFAAALMADLVLLPALLLGPLGKLWESPVDSRACASGGPADGVLATVES